MIRRHRGGTASAKAWKQRSAWHEGETEGRGQGVQALVALVLWEAIGGF